MSSLPVSKTGAPSPGNGPSAKSAASKDLSLAANRALLQRKLEEIVVLTRESTAADGVAVALRENGQFYCRASQGFAPEPGVVVEPGHGVCGRCIIDARVLVCQDLSGDVKSALAAPVIVGDEIEGLIAAFSFRQGAFDSTHIDLVSRVAVDIGNQIASPETIHLVPRDPVSILNDPRVEVVAVEESEPVAREKHLEVLGAVTAPNLAPVESGDATVDPVPVIEPASLAQAGHERQPEPLPFHFLGYDDSLPPELEPAPSRNELLGEYLSKWDIVVIFGAVLIAMIAFSVWVHYRRAQANRPYVAEYTQDTKQLAQAQTTTNVQSTSSETSPDTHSNPPPKANNTKAKVRPISISGGPTGLPLKPPPVQLANSGVPKTPPLPLVADPLVAVSGPTAPAELVHKVSPVYPANLRGSTEGKVVTLDLKVGTDGRVGMIKVVEGSNPFVSSALNAVRQWLYEPAVQNGKKIESSVRVEVSFDSTPR